MTDIGLSANTIAIIVIAYSIACAFVGAAFAFGVMERKGRKSKVGPDERKVNILT